MFSNYLYLQPLMSTTKQKILTTALSLFNKHGLSKITLRGIANEVGISQGNLNYHFKKRDDIIEALYHQLVSLIDADMELVKPISINIQTLYNISEATMTHFHKYRFFFLDFTQIMREQQKIRSHYNQLMILRREQTLALFDILMVQKLIRPEEIDDEYNNLYTRIQIISDFWMASTSLRTNNITPKTTQNFIKIISESIYPYLTKKGIKEYQKIA